MRALSGALLAWAAVVGFLVLAAEGRLGPRWHELRSGYTFEQYKADFGKEYSGAEEEAQRRAVFEANLATILAHNADTSKSWRMGVNQLTDMPSVELRRLHGYHKPTGMLRRSSLLNEVNNNKSAYMDRFTRAGSSGQSYPYEVDWRKEGVVSAVKNQGQCGSCWAFAAAESVESALAIATGELYVISVQEFVSCAPNELKCGGTGGCDGSVPQLAFDYAKANGVTEEWSYPYTSFYGKPGSKDLCKSRLGGNAVRVGAITGHYDLPTNDQDALMEAISFRGPVAISVDASAWHAYEEGVFDGCNQTNPDLDHAVQLVGYGTDPKDGDYWLVRNSWSPMWGERGYIRLRREATPRCGMDITPQHGTGCEGGPKEVKVCGTCGILFDNTIPIVERTQTSKHFVDTF